MGLAPEHKAKLRDNRVMFEEGVSKDSNIPGILCNIDHTRSAINVLRCEYREEGYGRVMVNGRESSGETSFIHFEFDCQKISFISWNSESYQDVKDIWRKVTREILSPVVKKNVHIYVPHQRSYDASNLDPSCFSVLVWSSPKGSASQVTPERIWGHKVDCDDGSFAPSGLGDAIIDDAGYPVAELIGNALYIHHDLCHRGTEDEMAIYRLVLKAAIDIMSLPLEVKLERQKAAALVRKAKSREDYIKQCSGRFEKLLRNTERAIVDGEKKVKRLQQELVVAIRELQGSAKKLEQLKAANGGMDATYGAEFDKLHTIKKIKFVEVANGTVSVFTDVIYCVNPNTNRRHEIGAFRIDINVGGQNDCVRWFNLTRKVNGYKPDMNAPHVFTNGEACFGNSAEVFAELVANYEFAAAAMVAIQFVESVNIHDSAGQYIDRWPIAEEKSEASAA